MRWWGGVVGGDSVGEVVFVGSDEGGSGGGAREGGFWEGFGEEAGGGRRRRERGWFGEGRGRRESGEGGRCSHGGHGCVVEENGERGERLVCVFATCKVARRTRMLVVLGFV